MKVFLVLAVAVAVAAAAPTDPGQRLVYGVRRSKKSAYGAPCAGSAAQPIALYLAPQQAYGGAQHYREEETPEAEHEQPSARSYYEPSAVAASVPALSVSPLVASGPAVGVFPNAKVGGCAVPLLLSCAPNVVSGHLVKQHGYAAPAYAAPAYRDADANMEEMKEAASERAAHHQPAHHEHEAVQHQHQHLAVSAPAPHHLQPASVAHGNQKLTSHHQ